MSEKKKKKEIDNEPVGSVSLQRSKDWWTVIHRSGALQLGSCFIPLFYDILMSGTKTHGYWGGEL